MLTLCVVELFLGLFDEAVISVLHCMAIDMELHDGRPRYGPPTFHEKMNVILGSEVYKKYAPQAKVYKQEEPVRERPPHTHP